MNMEVISKIHLRLYQIKIKFYIHCSLDMYTEASSANLGADHRCTVVSSSFYTEEHAQSALKVTQLNSQGMVASTTCTCT